MSAFPADDEPDLDNYGGSEVEYEDADAIFLHDKEEYFLIKDELDVSHLFHEEKPKTCLCV